MGPLFAFRSLLSCERRKEGRKEEGRAVADGAEGRVGGTEEGHLSWVAAAAAAGPVGLGSR